MQVTINRQLLGLEDLLFGEGTVEQTRGGQLLTVTKINATNLPFDNTRTLAEAMLVIDTEIIPNLATILASPANAQIAADAASDTQNLYNLVASLYDQFDDRYLGSKDADPILDNDGNILLVGALYFNTITNKMRVWDGVTWGDSLVLTTTSISTLTNKTIDDISNKVGANHIHYPVRNVSGSTIAAGTVVTAQGTQSGTDYVEVVPVTNPQTQIALGIMHTTVANNGTGLCMNTGVSADQVDTSGWAVGTILYPNNTGGLTSTKPTSGHYQACAVVLRSHANQGTLLVEFTEPKYIASTTQAGYVQLNNTLTSTSTVQALTAAQGKVLQDGKQPLDATLTALAGVTTSADKYIYATAADTFTTGTITSFGRSLVDDVDAATARGTLGISATNTPSAAVGRISATNVQGALQELDSEKVNSSDLVGAIGNINSPLLDMPLKNSLAMKSGVGSATFTRATTATYIDRYGVLKVAQVDEPRFEKEGYLNEGDSTNLLTYSEQFDNAVWAKNQSTIVSNTGAVTDPYGTNFADKLVENSTTNVHSTYRSFTPVSTTLTASFFVKAGEVSKCRISTYEPTTPANSIIADFDLVLKTAVIGNASTTNASIKELSNGWFLISASTISAALVQTTVSLQLTRLGASPYLGDGTSGLYIFGAQLEALPFATSYIPTVASTVTRSADVLSVTTIGNLPNTQTQNPNMSIIVDVDNSVNDRVQLIYANYSSTLNSLQLYINSDGSTRLSAESTNVSTAYIVTTDVLTKRRLAYTFGNGIVTAYRDGTQLATDTWTGNMTDSLFATNISIGSQNGIVQLYGHISNFRIFDRALTAQEVALA